MSSKRTDYVQAIQNAQMCLGVAHDLAGQPLDEFRRMWIRAAVAAAIGELEALPGSFRPTLIELEHARWNRSVIAVSGEPEGLRSLSEG